MKSYVCLCPYNNNLAENTITLKLNPLLYNSSMYFIIFFFCYRAIVSHGFSVDDEGKKMSKSLGNIVHPYEITHGGIGGTRKDNVYGVDGLRYWNLLLTSSCLVLIRIFPMCVYANRNSLTRNTANSL